MSSSSSIYYINQIVEDSLGRKACVVDIKLSVQEAGGGFVHENIPCGAVQPTPNTNIPDAAVFHGMTMEQLQAEHVKASNLLYGLNQSICEKKSACKKLNTALKDFEASKAKVKHIAFYYKRNELF